MLYLLFPQQQTLRRAHALLCFLKNVRPHDVQDVENVSHRSPNPPFFPSFLAPPLPITFPFVRSFSRGKPRRTSGSLGGFVDTVVSTTGMHFPHHQLNQARLERRRRRRDDNRKLRDLFGQMYTTEYPWNGGSSHRHQNQHQNHPSHQHNTSKPTTKNKRHKSVNDNDQDDNDDKVTSMWRHLFRNSSSASQARKIKKAWDRWLKENRSQDDEKFKQKMGSTNTSTGWTYTSYSHFCAGTGTSNRDNFQSSPGGQWTAGYESFTWEYGSTEGNAQHPKFQQYYRQQPQQRRHEQRHRLFLSAKERYSLAVLGFVNPTNLPTAAALKSAFRSLALAVHPDRHQQCPKAAADAEIKFKEIQEAFQIVAPLCPSSSSSTAPSA